MEQILPCVTDYDYARLAVGIPTLCRALEKLATKPRTEFQLSERVALLMLAALGKVGDGRATVVVERVAQKAFSARCSRGSGRHIAAATGSPAAGERRAYTVARRGSEYGGAGNPSARRHACRSD